MSQTSFGFRLLVKRRAAAAAAPGAMSSSSKPTEQEYEVTEYGSKRYNICGMRFETTPNYAVKKAVGQARSA